MFAGPRRDSETRGLNTSRPSLFAGVLLLGLLPGRSEAVEPVAGNFNNVVANAVSPTEVTWQFDRNLILEVGDARGSVRKGVSLDGREISLEGRAISEIRESLKPEPKYIHQQVVGGAISEAAAKTSQLPSGNGGRIFNLLIESDDNVVAQGEPGKFKSASSVVIVVDEAIDSKNPDFTVSNDFCAIARNGNLFEIGAAKQFSRVEQEGGMPVYAFAIDQFAEGALFKSGSTEVFPETHHLRGVADFAPCEATGGKRVIVQVEGLKTTKIAEGVAKTTQRKVVVVVYQDPKSGKVTDVNVGFELPDFMNRKLVDQLPYASTVWNSPHRPEGISERAVNGVPEQYLSAWSQGATDECGVATSRFEFGLRSLLVLDPREVLGIKGAKKGVVTKGLLQAAKARSGDFTPGDGDVIRTGGVLRINKGSLELLCPVTGKVIADAKTFEKLVEGFCKGEEDDKASSDRSAQASSALRHLLVCLSENEVTRGPASKLVSDLAELAMGSN